MNYFFVNIINTILVSIFFDNNYYTFLLTRTLGMYFLYHLKIWGDNSNLLQDCDELSGFS